VNPTTEQTLERITLYELADNIGLMYVNRSETVAASLAIELISHVLAQLGTHTLTDEQCASPSFLLMLATQGAVKASVATLLAVPQGTVTHNDVSALLLKLANQVWAFHAGHINYPGTQPGPAQRAQFKSALVTTLSTLPHSPTTTLTFIANLLDRHCTRTTQKLLIDSLTVYDATSSLLSAQPSLTECLLAELRAVFTDLPATLAVPDLNSLWFVTPSATSQPDTTLAALIQRLLSGEPDTQPADNNRVLRYRTPHASTAFSQLPITEVQYRRFTARMQTLGAVYVEALKAYWASPAYNNGVTSASKQDVYAEHLASQLQTELRLLCADDTLPAASAAMLRQVLEYPAAAERQAAHPANPVKVLRVGIQNLRTHVGRKLASVVAFITDEADSASTGAVLYAPGHGIEVFSSHQSLKDEMNRRFNDREDLLTWLPHVHANDYAETAFFNKAHKKKFKTAELTSPVFTRISADLLEKQYKDVHYLFKHANALGLQGSLGLLSQRLDNATRRQVQAAKQQLLAARTTRLLMRVPPQEVAQALFVQQNPDQPLPPDNALPIMDLAAIFNPPARLKTLTKDAEFYLLAQEMFATDAAQTVLREVAQTLHDYLPPALPVSTQAALVLSHKCISHHRKAPDIDSRQYRCFFAIEQSMRKARFFSTDYHYLTNSLQVLGASPTFRAGAEVMVQQADWDRVQAFSAGWSATLHQLIGGAINTPDLAALASALNFNALFPDPSLPDSGLHALSINAVLTLLMDSPEFHRLETRLLSASTWTKEQQKNASPGLIRALAVSIITDYLYPPASHRPGYVCGFNLNAKRLGDLTFEAVRQLVKEHLRSTLKCTSHQELNVAFGVLASRYCPELLIFDVPPDLRFGNTRDAVDFKHAVALAELTLPGAAVSLGYQALIKLVHATHADTLSTDQALAVSALRKTPVLHLAMCRGVIPESDIADVTPEDLLSAFQYVMDLDQQHAQTLTTLVQQPPDRKRMALRRLAEHHPGVDINHPRAFTESEINKYFVNRYKSRGRNMRLSLLEMYMTCGQDRAFDDQVLGFDTQGRGGCTLNNAFNTAYDTFQTTHDQALAAQLKYAIKDLPESQRLELLSANHFLKLQFDVDNTYVPGHFGLLAVNTDPANAYVYEVFCPSGTIRKLTQEGGVISHYATYDTSGLIRTDHYVTGLPALDVNAYTTGSTGTDRSRPALELAFMWSNPIDTPLVSRIRMLSERMVEHIFSHATRSARAQFIHATPYERYRNELVAKTELIFNVFIPFYSLYKDIQDENVNAVTIATALLEILSFVLPFGKAAYSGYRASLLLGKIVVRSTSFGVSRAALLTMRTAYASRAFVIALSKGLVQAAHPFALVGLLFQGGLKGAALVQRALLLRRKLKFVPPLAQLETTLNPQSAVRIEYPGPSIRPKNIGPLKHPINPFRPDFTWGNRKLDVLNQQRFHHSNVDLSTATFADNAYQVAGKQYIKMQGNVFAIRQLPSGRATHLYKGDTQGPAVWFNAGDNQWELETGGLLAGAPPRPLTLSRQISLPMDGVLEAGNDYMVLYERYMLPVAYDANLGAWRQLHEISPNEKSLGDPLWRDQAGTWRKGSVEAFVVQKSRTPTPTRLKDFSFPTLPVVPDNAVAIPNRIHYIWLGTQMPPAHLIDNIAINLTRASTFISTLHLDVSDTLFASITALCREKVPTLVISKLQDEPFFEVFKNSPNAEHYQLIKVAESQLYASACDVLRFPLTNYYGGIYIDMDDVLKQTLIAEDLKAAPDDVLLGNLVTLAEIDFHGYNSSHFGTQPNNPVLTAISAEMHARYRANKAFYLKPKPTLDEQLPPAERAKARAHYNAYFKEYFHLTGPTLLNDVLARERRVCYETAFQVVQGKTVFETASIADPLYLEQLNTAFDHYFPFARKYEIDTGSEHSWKQGR
jgi:hypothetical protein